MDVVLTSFRSKQYFVVQSSTLWCGGVVVFLWWCGGVFVVVVFLRWCSCGGVFAVFVCSVLMVVWWRFCGGGVFVVAFVR